MRHGPTFVITAAVGLIVSAGPCLAGVADPLAALKALYGAYQSSPADTASRNNLDTLYLWADRQLKRKMLANGICKIPLGKREVVCKLANNPVGGGSTADVGPAVVTQVAGNTTERRLTVVFPDGDGASHEIIFRFARSGREWELTTCEGTTPLGGSWSLSEIIGDG